MSTSVNSTDNSPISQSNAVVVPQNSFFLELPTELAIEILTQNPSDIGTWYLVCKQWHVLLNNETIAKGLFLRLFPDIKFEKTDYLDTYKFHANLTNGVYALYTLVGHQYGVRCVVSQDGQIISGSWDNSIKIWENNACKATLLGHTEGVCSVAIQGKKIISGSWDKSINIWENNACIATLRGHEDGVSSVTTQDEMIISISFDKTIKIWKNNTCEATLVGHEDHVTCVITQGGQIISGSKDKTIRIWENNTCTATLRGHEDSVNCLTTQGEDIISGSDDKTIKIWKNYICVATLFGHQGLVSAVTTQGRMIISSSEDKTIRIWENYACKATLRGHQEGVGSVAIQGRKIISGSQDTTINIWDFTASCDIVFNEIADLLESEESKNVEQAMQRFVKMPKTAKSKIYGELYKILKSQDQRLNDYCGCGEHAFYGQHGQTSTPLQRAQAIRNYLQESSSQ